MTIGTLVFAIIAGVLLFNLGLYLYARRHKPGGQIALLQKAFRSMKDPFAEDDAALEELSRRVEALRRKTED